MRISAPTQIRACYAGAALSATLAIAFGTLAIFGHQHAGCGCGSLAFGAASLLLLLKARKIKVADHKVEVNGWYDAAMDTEEKAPGRSMAREDLLMHPFDHSDFAEKGDAADKSMAAAEAYRLGDSNTEETSL